MNRQSKSISVLRLLTTLWGRAILAIVLSIPSAIVTSLCLTNFWLAQGSIRLGIAIGLVLIFSLFYWLLLTVIRPIVEERNISLLTLLFLLLAILAPIGMLYDGVKSQLLILTPTQVDLSLSSQSNEPARLRIVSATLKNSGRTFTPARLSRDCEVRGEALSVAPGKSCQVSYLVTSYEADRLEIDFDLSQSVGILEVSTPIGGNRYEFDGQGEAGATERFSVALSWVQKRIKLPVFFLLGFSLFSLFLFIGLILWSRFHDHTTRSGNVKPISEYWIYLIFALIAFILANARFGSGIQQTISMPSDAGNIASYLAAGDYPENFEMDELLSNPENFSEYFTVYLPIVSGLSRLTGSYASAFLTLVVPVTLLHLLGYYLLGKKILMNRLMAFCFALVTAIPISLPLSEYFGLSPDILPRTLYQAVLPYGLLLLLAFKSRPHWFWLVSLAFTLMLYIHPVSGPAWVGVCLLSLLIFSIRALGKGWWKSFLPALFIFLAGVVPFLNAYLRPKALDTLDATLLSAINLTRYSSQTKPILELYRSDMWTYLRENWSLITLSLVFLGFSLWMIVRFIIQKNKIQKLDLSEKNSGLLLVWWGVLILVAVLIPLLDEAIATAFDRGLVLREIRRTMRYYIPMLWLNFFWVCQRALIVFGEARQPSNGKFLVWIAIFSLFVTYGIETKVWKNPIFVRQAECLQSGEWICKPDEDALAMYEFYTELQIHVQPNESVFPDPDPQYLADSLIPRYHSLRSVAYTYKDGGAVGDFLPEWWRITQGVKPYLPNSERGLHPSVVEVARTTGAAYFYFIQPDEKALEYLKTQEIVFQNGYGVLISLK